MKRLEFSNKKDNATVSNFSKTNQKEKFEGTDRKPLTQIAAFNASNTKSPSNNTNQYQKINRKTVLIAETNTPPAHEISYTEGDELI